MRIVCYVNWDAPEPAVVLGQPDDREPYKLLPAGADTAVDFHRYVREEVDFGRPPSPAQLPALLDAYFRTERARRLQGFHWMPSPAAVALAAVL